MTEAAKPDLAAQKAAAAEAKKIAKEKLDAEKAAAKAKADAAKAEAKAVADAAKAAKKAAADAEAKAKAEAKAAEQAAKAAAAAEKKTKVVMPSNNGVTRPKAEGACGKVWAIADAMSEQLGQPVPISMLSKETAKAGLNDATTRTQYARWKTFNGVFGQVAKPAANDASTAAAA